MNTIIDGLAALVGRANVAADPASLEEYAQDESFVPRLTPWAVVRPGSAEEVQQVVAWPTRRRLRWCPSAPAARTSTATPCRARPAL